MKIVDGHKKTRVHGGQQKMNKKCVKQQIRKAGI